MASRAIPIAPLYPRRRTTLARSRPLDEQIRPILQIIPNLPRRALERLADGLIEHLNELDGDLDLEPNGDELDGTDRGEDEFWHHASWRDEPGCALGDPG